MSKRLLLLLFIALLVLAGCYEKSKNTTSEDEKVITEKNVSEKDDTSDAEKEESIEDLPGVPSTTEGVVNQPPGLFAGMYVEEDPWTAKMLKEMKKAPALPDNPSDEEYDQYFTYIYSLASEDFPDPQELIKKWEYAISGTPDATDDRFQFKDNYNIEIILDSSGSMNNTVNGRTQMDLAKETINNFLASVPDKANVSLRVYGHKGSGSDSDKKLSCSSIEQVYGFDTYKKEEFDQALNQFNPSGWTPIEGALKASKEAFSKYNAKNNTNLIYLVSDGIETCDGNPAEFAKTLQDSEIKPIVNVIGFNVNGEAQKQLKAVAANSDGVYTTVTSAEQLENEFNRTQEVLESWNQWKEDALYDLDGKSTDVFFDIRDFSINYDQKARAQDNRVWKIIQISTLENLITNEEEKELTKRRKGIEQLVDESLSKIESDLKNTGDKKIEEIAKEINEKYDSNVKE
ncbi:VWA domain-containing protein [Rossellomorea vietnamensis]|uniref:VWA domain-containing protein n=1 Tax=Rossellomorea vietnamensis TaxID=218284 RepID=UPI001E31EC8E|nr:VWA domain-containing protein [Rossellomorea vietnamensis]MCC5804410.1 VWA domain-containing protein [Rossellomorea vietnamensis]